MKQLPKGATIKPHIVMPLFHLAVADLNGEEHSGEEFRKVSWGLIDLKRLSRNNPNDLGGFKTHFKKIVMDQGFANSRFL